MFEAKFANASLLKKIIEAVKDLVNEAPFDCTENAMCLQAMDGSHVALVSLKMEIGLFETYRCDRTISLGLSLTELSKIFKCSKSDDTCMIRFEEGAGSDNVAFTFEDMKGRKQDITLKLMDIDNEHLGIHDQKYSCVVEMPSVEFQKICRDVAAFSDTMTITATKSGVVFSGSGDAVSNTITYKKDHGLDEDDDERVDITVKEKVHVHFSIKYLVNFSKASTLSKRVRISLCDQVPIVVEYDIEENGYLRFYLAPKIDEQDKEMEDD